MMHIWFYRSRGKVSGPINFAELAQLAASGGLLPHDELRRGEDGAWTPAGSMVGLFPEPQESQEPQELHDLAELDFEFVESASVPRGTERIATLEELNIQIISEASLPRKGVPAGAGGPPPTEAVAEQPPDDWYYQSFGQELGPMPLWELVQLAGDGVILPNDPVRCGASGGWQRAARVPELMTVIERANPAGTIATDRPAGRTASPIGSSQHSTPVKHSTALDNGESQAPPTRSDEPQRDQSPPPSAEPEPPLPADRWFCRIDDIEHGPLTREELTAMARHGRIKPETPVKLGDAGEWTSAATIEGVFAGAETPPSAATPGAPAASAGPALSAAYVAPKPKKEKKSKRPRGPREPLMPRLKEIIAKNKLVVFGALGVVVVAAVVIFFASGQSSSDEEYLIRLQAILDEHNALKKGKAGPEEWNRLLSKAEALQAEILPVLKKTASSDRPERQELLWAAEDMIPMLQNATKSRNHHEETFAKHLKEAARLLKIPGNFGSLATETAQGEQKGK